MYNKPFRIEIVSVHPKANFRIECYRADSLHRYKLHNLLFTASETVIYRMALSSKLERRATDLKMIWLTSFQYFVLLTFTK